MPSLLIKSNVEASEPEREVVMKECSAAVSSCTGKPESFILVSYERASMIFGGSSAPCAYIYLASLGALGPTVNPSVVEAISDILGSRLGIPQNRIYVQFCDVKDRGDFGWNGTTFG